jgi:hypothetical protein
LENCLKELIIQALSRLIPCKLEQGTFGEKTGKSVFRTGKFAQDVEQITIARVLWGHSGGRITRRGSAVNQREYCELNQIPLKAFGNWRAKFSGAQPPTRKLLYRRGGLSQTLSHSLSRPLSHMTYPSSWADGPTIPPACDGHRRRFSEADERRILEEPAQSDAGPAKVARRYGILSRWKQELIPPAFVAVQVTNAPSDAMMPRNEEHES